MSLSSNSEKISFPILVLMNHKTMQEERFIIGKRTAKVNESVYLCDYHSQEVRLLLTQIFKSGHSIVKYYGTYYSVKEYTPMDRIIRTIEIGENGGLLASIRDDTYPPEKELVDVLLFSPFTQCYEIQHATRYIKSNECYISAGLYRDFVKKYGNPGLKIVCLKERSEHFNGSLLNEESLLHEFGYSVSKNSGMDAKERQLLLSDIIDMNIMKQEAVINLFTMLIGINKNKPRNMSACSKWDADLDFVKNYKYNPERFLIYHK
jgi:hypothetical protein